MDRIQLLDSLLDKRPALYFDDAGEAGWHEEEVQLFIGLAHFFSMAELPLQVVERLQAAALRTINELRIFEPPIAVNRVWNLEEPSEDYFSHEARQLDRLGVVIVSTFVVEAESRDRHV